MAQAKTAWSTGRWTVNQSYPVGEWLIHAPADSPYALASCFEQNREGTHSHPAFANAHLIAAAPDLYAALDEAVNYLAVRVAINGDEKTTALLNTCTAALAKAIGQHQERPVPAIGPERDAE